MPAPARTIAVTNSVGRTFNVAIGCVIETSDNEGHQRVTGFDKKHGMTVLELVSLDNPKDEQWCYADSIYRVVSAT